MFALTEIPIKISYESAQLENKQAGALATFEGWVRNHNEGQSVNRLEYEAYEALALTEGAKIIEEAKEKFGILDARCTHRTGLLEIGEAAVWVGAVSPHRDEAFRACRYIIDEIKIRLPIWKKEHYTNGHQAWVNCQQCSSTKRSKYSDNLNEDEFYSRQQRLKKVGKEGQEKLKNTRVLVVGAGGLGCSALLYLTGAGVGTLGICDHDVLSVSNLHRQVLYTANNMGKRKAELAQQRVKALNPFISIQTYTEKLSTENVVELFEQYDIILDCTDSLRTKFLMNDAAVLTKTALIQSSVYQYEGQLSLYDPTSSSGCLRCQWKELPEESAVGNCAEVGVLGVVPGLFGTLQATEAIKYILDIESPVRNQLLLFDLTTCQTDFIWKVRNLECVLCGDTPSITSLENSVVQSMSDLEITYSEDTDEIYQWIDIRESEEVKEQPCLVDTLDIPLSTFNSQDLIGIQRPILLICRRGKRSLILAHQLKEEGVKNVFSLSGGVERLPLKMFREVTVV